MKRKAICVAPLCLLAGAAFCADDGEVHFRPQAYKPGKELNARAYSEKSYTVSEKAASRPVGSVMTPAQVKQPEAKPLVVKEPLNAKPLEAPPPLKTDAFKQSDKQTYASTITPSKTATAERQPYLASTNKLGYTAFTLQEKPKEKDPMLQPRQGIKELPVDDGPR